MFIAPDFFMPIVNEGQMGAPSLNTRATEHAVFEALGHLKPGVNAAASPFRYEVSPKYFEAASTTLLAGRTFSWQDDKNAPAVAIINRDFAGTMFGSVTSAIGRNYRLQDGTSVQVVGVVEDGKYMALTEAKQTAMFLT